MRTVYALAFGRGSRSASGFSGSETRSTRRRCSLFASFAGCFLILASTNLLGGCVVIQNSVYNAGLKVMRHRSGVEPGLLEHGTAYLERSEGEETVVLLHGFASEKDTWLRFVRHLPKQYKVIALDLPGHGQSIRRYDRSYDVDSMAVSIGAALDELAPERFHLVGNSLGGMVAMIYALENPHRIYSLGLFDAAGVYPESPSVFQELLAQGENPLLVSSADEFDRLVDLVFVDRPRVPWPVRPVLVRRMRNDVAFSRKMWGDIWSQRRDLAPELSQIHAPVFLLWGDGDRILDVSSVRVFERHLPRVSTVIMEECGHSPMAERPREAAAHYARFLADVGL